VYISIDADGMDPAEMPGVLAPVPGGLKFTLVAYLLRETARCHRVVGMDIVEIAPMFDTPGGITCITAGRLILNLLGASWPSMVNSNRTA
jgi:agmatinase